jgi:hypothetical protein
MLVSFLTVFSFLSCVSAGSRNFHSSVTASLSYVQMRIAVSFLNQFRHKVSLLSFRLKMDGQSSS